VTPGSSYTRNIKRKGRRASRQTKRDGLCVAHVAEHAMRQAGVMLHAIRSAGLYQGAGIWKKAAANDATAKSGAMSQRTVRRGRRPIDAARS